MIHDVLPAVTCAASLLKKQQTISSLMLSPRMISPRCQKIPTSMSSKMR